MRIGFFEMEDWQKQYITPLLSGHELYFLKKNEDFSGNDIEVLSNFVAFPVNGEVLAKCPNLKFVTTRSTGYDHIDLKSCQQRNILVSNVPAYGENTVAEFTFAIMLALLRKVYQGVKRVREQGLFSSSGLEGSDLKGKTLGVIGTGHIGTYVVKIATGFSMNVLAYDPYPRQELAEKFNFKYVSLEDILGQSDILSLHVPYMPATHHLINSENIKFCKQGCVIVNTARGGLIETESLIKALKSGQVAGAALDVLEEEGFIKEELEMLTQGHPNEQQLKVALADHELMQMDNVIITPHNAFNTREAMQRILQVTADNIKNFASGSPINLVK